MTLKDTLESALIGQATKADVIAACDAELAKGIEMNQPTTHQTERAQKYYSDMAQEPVKFEVIGGTMYVFGSELACLRILNKMRGNPTARAAYSDNLKTWYYTHEAK